jgi:hypothetical protein
MAMDAFLAEYYGTNKTASAPQEDLEKQASVELFLKLASESNIDLKSMPDTKVQELYDSWVSKTAAAAAAAAPAAPAAPAAEDDEEDEEKKKHEEAKKEHEEKKAAAEKVAEADFLGRVMAHSYVQEMRKIAAAAAEATPAADEAAKEAFAVTQAGHKFDAEQARAKQEQHGKNVESIKSYAKEHPFARHLMRKTEPLAVVGHTLQERHAAHVADKHEKGKNSYNPFGGMLTKTEREKASSAIDELAFERAQKIAADGGFDAEEAANKIAAAFTLNLVEESTKVASAPDVGTAVEVRALELLERVGYPVQWAQ